MNFSQFQFRGMRPDIFLGTYAKAFPFDKMVEGMLPPRMVEETVEILRAGVRRGFQMNLLINNRAGGNAPLIAERIAEEFLGA
jgi:hypothetical protein